MSQHFTEVFLFAVDELHQYIESKTVMQIRDDIGMLP